MTIIGEIILAFSFWIGITVLTPARVRPFISAMSLLVLLFFIYMVFQKPVPSEAIHIPSLDGQAAYELSFEDYQALTSASEPTRDFYELQGVSELYRSEKALFIHKDLNEAQLLQLQGLPGYQAFLKGEKGFIIKRFAPQLIKGELRHESFGGRLIDLPFMDVTRELRQEKSKIRAIKMILDQGSSLQEQI